MSLHLPQKTDFEKWSVEQLFTWLNERNMAEVADVFLKKQIDGYQMLNLREEMLIIWGRELKIRMRLEVLKLIKEIKRPDIFSRERISELRNDNQSGSTTFHENSERLKNLNVCLLSRNNQLSSCKKDEKLNKLNINLAETQNVSLNQSSQDMKKLPPPCIPLVGDGDNLPALLPIHHPMILPLTRPLRQHRSPPSIPLLQHRIPSSRPFLQHRASPSGTLLQHRPLRPLFRPPPRPNLRMPHHQLFKPQLPVIPNPISVLEEKCTKNEIGITLRPPPIRPLRQNSSPQRSMASALSVPLPNRKLLETNNKDTGSSNLPQDGEYLDLGNNQVIQLTPLYRSIMANDFFHAVNRSSAINMLNSKDGMFIVRPSTHSSNALSLSLSTGGTISHISIRIREDGKFALGLTKTNEKTFGSVEELVEYHKKIPIKRKDGSTTLLYRTPPKPNT